MYDVLSFNAIKLNEDGNVIKNMNKRKFIGKGENFFAKLVKNKCEFTVPWGYIYNTQYFKSHKFLYPKGKILEDYYLTPMVIIEAEKLISIDLQGYYYISNSNSIMNNKENQDKMAQIYWNYFDELNEIIEKANYNKRVKKVYKQFLANTLIWYGSLLNNDEQKEYIKKIKERKVKSSNLLVAILYKMNMYYSIRKIIKK